MEKENIGLTKEEKVMFAILGIILVIAIVVSLINNISKNERTLDEETPITEKKETENNDNSSNPDINLKEDNTDNTNTTNNNKVVYVANLTAKNKNQSSVKDTSKNDEKDNNEKNEDSEKPEETIKPVITEWDFPSSIVTESFAGTTILIDKNVILKDGTKKEAQVTVRKLVDDIYMIEDISSGSLTLTEGTYKYYYTYANITKELILTVKGYLNPVEAHISSIKDTSKFSEEYLNAYAEMIERSNITITENTINFNLDQNSKVVEIPIYLTLNEKFTKLSDVEIESNTFGVTVDKTTSSNYESLNDNQIVLLINLEVANVKNLNEVVIVINNITYIVNLNINVIPEHNEDDQEKENDNQENNKEEDNKNEQDNESNEQKNEKDNAYDKDNNASKDNDTLDKEKKNSESDKDKDISNELEIDVKLPDKTNPNEITDIIEVSRDFTEHNFNQLNQTITLYELIMQELT